MVFNASAIIRMTNRGTFFRSVDLLPNSAFVVSVSEATIREGHAIIRRVSVLIAGLFIRLIKRSQYVLTVRIDFRDVTSYFIRRSTKASYARCSQRFTSFELSDLR